MINDFKFVDTHCHIDLYPAYKQVIEDAESRKVFTVAVTNTPSVFGKMQELVKGKEYVQAALGMHPQLVKERWKELSSVNELITHSRFVGEIGLDYSEQNSENLRRQREVFSSILELCARAGNKILTIHSRRSAEDVVSAIGPSFNGKIILHWYSGSLKILERAVMNGYYFSVNHDMLVSKNGREIVKQIPLSRLLTESDGPFIALPAGPASPSSMELLVENLASFLDKDKNEIQQVINTNFAHCLN